MDMKQKERSERNESESRIAEWNECKLDISSIYCSMWNLMNADGKKLCGYNHRAYTLMVELSGSWCLLLADLSLPGEVTLSVPRGVELGISMWQFIFSTLIAYKHSARFTS